MTQNVKPYSFKIAMHWLLLSCIICSSREERSVGGQYRTLSGLSYTNQSEISLRKSELSGTGQRPNVRDRNGRVSRKALSQISGETRWSSEPSWFANCRSGGRIRRRGAGFQACPRTEGAAAFVGGLVGVGPEVDVVKCDIRTGRSVSAKNLNWRATDTVHYRAVPILQSALGLGASRNM